VLHDPIHGKYGSSARLWECDTNEGKILRNGQLKLGTTALTFVREIPLPVLTTEQRVAYAIHCALRVYVAEKFVCWAHNWLSGVDRSAEAADAAADAAAGSVEAAEWAAVWAAWSAAVWAVWSAASARAAESAADAAAESAAVWAAWSAAAMEAEVDLLSCAREAGIREVGIDNE
jgi:hypothetical protein